MVTGQVVRVTGRVGVHERRVQARYVVQQPVLGRLGHLVRGNDAERGVDHDLQLGAEPVTDPAQPDIADVLDPAVPPAVRSTRSTRAGSTASISRR